MQTIRVFVSSPSDVREERNSARAVLEQLRARFQGQVHIHGFFWEAEFYDGSSSIQDQLERPSTFDIVVVILWSTLGSAAYADPKTGKKYSSGTQFEIADTLSVSEPGRPTLLVCRCRREFLVPANRTAEEIQRLKANYDAAIAFLDKGVKELGVTAVNSFVTTADFAEVLRTTLVRRIKDIVTGRTDAPTTRTTEPYKGLRVLTAEDHGFFFGRSQAVHRVVEQLRQQEAAGRPFVLIFGRSGIGKSSFARAGVVPHIVRGGMIEGVARWRTALFEPSDSTTDLIGGLAAALCSEGVLPELARAFDSAEGFAKALRANPESTVHTLRSVLDLVSREAGGGDTRVLLLVDPMEEIFTRGSSPQDITSFATALKALCQSRLVWVLGTVRIDFYGACVEIPDLQVLEDGNGHFNLPPMSFSELQDAVVEPAERAGVRFGKSPDGQDLSAELVNAAVAMRGEPLPLLAYVLQQLYERSNAGVTGELSWKVYESLKRLPGLLNARADEARRTAEGRMTGGQEAAWNEVFGQLVGVDADNQRVRRYARPDAFTNPNAKILIQELDRARLIITDHDDQGQSVVTIAHEAMLRQWQALSSWIDHRETLLKTARALGADAKEWHRNERAEAYLSLRDTRLAAAEQFVANTQGVPVDTLTAEFVKAHVDRRDAESRRRRAVIRGVITGVTIALLITAGLCVFAYYSYRQSEIQRNSARVHAQKSDGFVDLMLRGVLPRLDPKVPANRPVIEQVTNAAVSHFQAEPPPGETRQEALNRADNIVRVARQVAQLSRYAEAVTLQKYALDTKLTNGLDDPSEQARMYLDLADYVKSKGESDRPFIDKAKEIVKANPDVDPLLILDVRADNAMSLRYEGKYVSAYAELEDIIKLLKAMGPSAGRVLDRAVDGYTESLRYAGHVDEGRAYYRDYVTAIEAAGGVVEPRYQVEYAVFLGLSPDTADVDDAVRRMKDAIEASPWQPEDAAQYQYKLARVLTDAKRLDEAQKYVDSSMAELSKPGKSSTKLAKCHEVRAKVRLARGDPAGALEDARTTMAIRKKKYETNTRHREYLDACTLLVDCLEAGGPTAELAAARREELDVRAAIAAQESETARKLDKQMPVFDRPPRSTNKPAPQHP